MYKKYHLKAKKTRKQNDKKKGGAKKPSKKSKKTRKNIKGGAKKVVKNIDISITADPVTNDDMMFIDDKNGNFKWTCSNGNENEDNNRKDFDCKIKTKKKNIIHRITGKKYNNSEGIKRKIAAAIEHQTDDDGMNLVLQNYVTKDNLSNNYWSCGCEKDINDDGDIDLGCECDLENDGKPPVQEWYIEDREQDDEPSDSEDENDDYDDFVSMPSEIDEEIENEEDKLENLKKELDDLEEEWERCQESGFGDPKFCSKVKRDLEARKRQMKGGGVKNTKKSKLSKLKSLIKDYERVIKKDSNKLIKFKSKEVSKDKSSKKSKKVSKGKSLKKSKKYTKKNTKK